MDERHGLVSVSVDDGGVRGLDRRGQAHGVEWADLAEVLIRTNSQGPFREDVFFVLRSRTGEELVVPHGGLPMELVSRLQRLDGFDNETMIAAMGSTEDAEFTCWRAG